MGVNETREESLVLHESVSEGRKATLADWCTSFGALGVVLAVFFLTDGTRWMIGLSVPVLALAAGILGAAMRGEHGTGFIRNGRYVLIYAATIALMISADLSVRALLGGDLWMVLSNWAVLIGSASAVNLFARVMLWGPRTRWLSEKDVSAMHPFTLFVAVVLQVLQLWISVLGAAWSVVLVQLLVRRVLMLPITHIIARLNYGPEAGTLLRTNRTLEYVAHRSVADARGMVREAHPLEQCTVGNMLLKLPLFGGEPMNAGRKSLTRIVDKIVFLEQIVAFSSPTFVARRHVAMAHIGFLQTLLSFDGDPANVNPSLEDRLDCKRRVRHFLQGRRRLFA